MDAAAPTRTGRADLTQPPSDCGGAEPRIIDEAGQAPLVEALQSGSATGDPAPLTRIDTHLSRVFVGPTRVYKLSRARRHPFVDLTAPAMRRAAAQAEVEINRILAPDLYERVATVTRSAEGAIGLDGPGAALDWVVVMKPIAPGAILDEMAEAGTLDAETVAELAGVVARFHAGLAPDLEAGRPERYRRVLEDLELTEIQGGKAAGAPRQSRDVFGRLHAELTRLAPLIEARRRDGWVRRGHGDLHLRNICQFEGRLTPFDALAFDASLATNDVLYDLAFLLMDLEARGLRAYANLAMNRYWDESGQPEAALALLPFFMALRAAVRMAVLTEGGELDEADRYHRLALDILRPAEPRLVAVGGLSGSGKSVVARALAPALPGPCGARLLRTDVLRKRLAGVAASDRLGQAAYAPQARAAVYGELMLAGREALAAGTSVVADATFQAREARDAAAEAAGRHPFDGLWLRAAGPVRAARIAARRGDPSDISAEVALGQSEPDSLGPGWRVLDAEAPAQQVVAEALGHLAVPPAAQAIDLDAKVRFLATPHAYPGLSGPVTTVETHMSWIFLAGLRAYKLKKPVRFDYLDFSTLALREAACRAELSLNRRLAPDIYLAVTPLRLGPSGLSIGGPGETVDWLVEMRRLDPTAALDVRLKNHVTEVELDRLAGRLARFYRHAQPVRITPAAHLTAWRRALDEDLRILLDPRLGMPAGKVRKVDRILRRFLRSQPASLAERVRRRRIVDAHGDLRPEHIWMGDPVRIIDCLEFSASLRANDPLDEVAFLDLECARLGAPEVGERIRRKTLTAMSEPAPEPLYGFYRCHRAMLRARLSIAHLLEPNPRTPQKWPAQARAYLDLALTEARRLERWLNRPSGRSADGGRRGG